MENTKQELRQQRGLQIAQTCRIVRTEKGWKVPSQSGQGSYIVVSRGFETKCNCPDYEITHKKCKHIWAVHYKITQEFDKDGNLTSVTETKTIQKKTYPQDWHNYNLAQTKEKELFMKLLADLTQQIPNPIYESGRPKTLFSDAVYSMIFKVYNTFSGRRFNSDMEVARNNAYITKRVPYNTMFDYFNKREIMKILCKLVTITSLPLKSVEKDFAMDSTGFGTGNFQRWFSYKHGKEISSREWIKCHFVCGVKTNIITSVKITSELEADCPQFKELYEETKKNFNMEEMSADKAYLSQDNLEHGENNGTKMFIPFKSNSLPDKKGGIWRRLYHYFEFQNEDFLLHYHKRSNGESTVNMVKSKFGDAVRSKNWVSQVNEVLCKIICHNISCVIT